MRSTIRLLATVKPNRYLTPGNPTGLTGLFTHPLPRPTLVYLYSQTLDKLRAFPEHSAYRAATEALTKHRLSIVEGIRPPGYEEWSAKAKKLLEEHPEVFNTPAGGVSHDNEKHVKIIHDGRSFVRTIVQPQVDERTQEWDGEEVPLEQEQGSKADFAALAKGRPGSDEKIVEWVQEPALEAKQVEELENQIGGGLIEEVIQVAEGELKLVDEMLNAKVWEELEDKAGAGQWQYFARDQHTTGTQEPPS
ncbi:hypothetical protein MMC34_006637 [Xylographa carneopallida]|nr:hypothetical protein [Xylographa carneopallida]